MSNRTRARRRAARLASIVLPGLLLGCLLGGHSSSFPWPTPAGVGQEPEAAPAGPVEPATVFVLRHAEKGADDPRDPALSAAGERRAQALARLLSRAGVTHLFATEYRRTRDTLAPLSRGVGVQTRVIGARERDEQVRALRALPAGSVAVVAGHSNTVPALIEALGGALADTARTARGPMLGDDEYDRLFVVTLPPLTSPPVEGVATVTIELRYGD